MGWKRLPHKKQKMPPVPTAEQKQQRSDLKNVLHSTGCCVEGSESCSVRDCDKWKALCAHVATCADVLCAEPGCEEACAALNHYHACLDAACFVCLPVRSVSLSPQPHPDPPPTRPPAPTPAPKTFRRTTEKRADSLVRKRARVRGTDMDALKASVRAGLGTGNAPAKLRLVSFAAMFPYEGYVLTESAAFPPGAEADAAERNNLIGGGLFQSVAFRTHLAQWTFRELGFASYLKNNRASLGKIVCTDCGCGVLSMTHGGRISSRLTSRTSADVVSAHAAHVSRNAAAITSGTVVPDHDLVRAMLSPAGIALEEQADDPGAEYVRLGAEAALFAFRASYVAFVSAIEVEKGGASAGSGGSV